LALAAAAAASSSYAPAPVHHHSPAAHAAPGSVAGGSSGRSPGVHDNSPELCGLTLEELQELGKDPRHADGMTVRDVVEQILRPDTAGSGLSYAALRCGGRPEQATVLVSHAWDAKYGDVISALEASGQAGPFWLCATSICLHEDAASQALGRQHDLASAALLGRVLDEVPILLCVLTPAGNIFTRLWCLFEIATAVRLGKEVRIASRRRKFGLGATDDLLIKLCRDPIDSSAASCGGDARALRCLLEAVPGGYQAIDSAVEGARLVALSRGREKLVGGGWKDTDVGRQYDEAINMVSARLRNMAEEMGESGVGLPSPKTSSRSRSLGHALDHGSSASPQRGVRKKPSAADIIGGMGSPTLTTPRSLLTAGATGTPRHSTRKSWAPTVSM